MQHPLLSNKEINLLLNNFDDPTVNTSTVATGASLADIAKRNTKKIVNEPDYLHVKIIQGQKYYSCPGSTVWHPEIHAKKLFAFSKIRGFIPS